MKLDLPALGKICTALVAFCGAIYFEFSPLEHSSAHALELFTAGLAALGWTASGVKASAETAELKAGQEQIKAGIADVHVAVEAVPPAVMGAGRDTPS